MLTTYKVPLVQINPITRSEKIPYVAGDDYQGAFSLTEHLIQLGHRRIAFLMGPRNLRSAFDRFYGFRAALDSHQIVLNEEWVKNSEFTFDGGYTATRLLLDQPLAPTAIFAGNDEAAYGALFALQEMGKIVPRDVSVCGYDDYGTSKNIWPGLTTAHQPAEEMLENATRLLIRILKGEKQTEQNMLLSSPLVIRGSTGRVTAEP
jgi:LacI family transcriptional regulator